ncbi:Methyltransferase gidB [Borrelia nietonii YOR]|uniref:Ribosomal RNA small subunit methyltransferase G n=1 Tax=Borrelia nietonii YOR TaxID=1293576 RepID=A0ABM7NXW8_9SPIR|nr:MULTISPECIES: 16S rRNA (guanine(527)-N(7))-methyltransferase RsmG [Borrelia]AHH03136.1 Methyltransferase gidB [Borrelia nietonii YOR]AHH13674.1 Methyltransferase gidB [Borrelia hermsii MTW]UPA08903.1 16S rRNA (guanine(527)-N(7))-methyltransferase RsmG [Borrelia nietonii YOR]
MINYFELSLKNLGVPFTSESIDKLKFYIKRVLLFGSRFNLVSKNDLNFDAVLLHALDSVVGLPIIKDNNPHQVLDVGSGAGFPGIILAIFDNSRKYVLLERSNKKVTFLRMMGLELGLENVEVLERDVADEKDKYEFITIRAFRDIREYASILRLILKDGGLIMAYKGRFDKIKFEISHIESLFSKIEIKESAISDAKERNFLLLYK